MNLLDFLKQVKKHQLNQFFIYYKNEDGELRNICFQDNKFFKVERNKKVRFVNPLRAMDIFDEILEGKLKFVGIGKYMKKIDFIKDYNYYSCIDNNRRLG